MLEKTRNDIAIAFWEDPAKVVVAVALAAVTAATVVAISFLPLDTQEVLFGAFGSAITALLTGLATRKRAWSPRAVDAEAERSYREGVRAGAGQVD